MCIKIAYKMASLSPILGHPEYLQIYDLTILRKFGTFCKHLSNCA